ncbi:MAG: right-handed parallel beta-helix repeat-containing protein, partial [Prevotella sp.]|nr:right-handed parallel beta-helix repeat-containing protein [Prevotella sp.]
MIRRLFLFVTTLTLLLTACTDTDSFTADRNQRLTFQQDTVWLDTLFTGVPSATYGFWVHNRSADGLRISTVRLERGNQTGFRVNVDGTFLNPVAQDLEVRKGDSLLVFVELTAYENHSDEPRRVDDNLLFTLESGVVQRVNLCAYSWDAERLTSLHVERDTTLTSVRPLVVYGDGITVAPGATLTLRNTTLYFHGDARLRVEGRLVVEHCVLRGDRLDRMFSYLPYDRISGQWRGIEVAKGAAGCWLTDTEVRNAWDALTADSTRVVLSNSVLHNSRGHGLYAKDSQVELDGCQLSNAEGDCLSL